MDPAVWIAYLVATIILSLSPGPGVFSSISSGLHHGFRLGVWNGIGMQLANLVLMAIVALGLGAILPQFVDPAQPQLVQYAVLALTTFVVDIVAMSAYMALAAKLLGAMRDPAKLRWVNRGLGGAFMAAGVALATFRRAAHI